MYDARYRYAVHVPRQTRLPEMQVEPGLKQFFKTGWVPKDASEMASKYSEWDILGVIFSVDTETSTGEPPDSNDYVAEIVRKHPQQFIGFASVDHGKRAVRLRSWSGR